MITSALQCHYHLVIFGSIKSLTGQDRYVNREDDHNKIGWWASVEMMVFVFLDTDKNKIRRIPGQKGFLNLFFYRSGITVTKSLSVIRSAY